MGSVPAAPTSFSHIRSPGHLTWRDQQAQQLQRVGSEVGPRARLQGRQAGEARKGEGSQDGLSSLGPQPTPGCHLHGTQVITTLKVEHEVPGGLRTRWRLGAGRPTSQSHPALQSKAQLTCALLRAEALLGYLSQGPEAQAHGQTCNDRGWQSLAFMWGWGCCPAPSTQEPRSRPTDTSLSSLGTLADTPNI